MVPAQGAEGEARVAAVMMQQILSRAISSRPFNLARAPMMSPDQVGIAMAYPRT